MLNAAQRGGTEADFRREASRILEDAAAKAGLTISPRDEFSVARGRVDSLYNRLILEYKKPGVIGKSNEGQRNQAIIQQVKGYVLDVAKRERREAQRLAGVALDGFHLIFVRRVGEGWVVDAPVEVNAASTERFLRLLFSLSAGAALVPENLVEDFGPKTLRAQRAARALFDALNSSSHPLVKKLFEQWRLFFSEATDYKEWSQKIAGKKEFQSFLRGMGISLDLEKVEYEVSGRRATARGSKDPYLIAKAFFVLHTYYALLIKLVASLAAARFAGGTTAPLVGMAAKTGDDLREAFRDLEAGGLFKQYGFRNFLEGDFFGWYLAAWNDDVEEAVSRLVSRLSEYDPGTLELAPENARDLLKKLYHYLLPREIRHDLGEYYTPDWLAERLVRQTLGTADLGDPTKRVLDPACGSGTFLVILIKHIRERAEKKGRDPGETLDLILQNVVGFDLNPLAVIAARTNYLLALGDLLKARKGDVDIPVYQADSILTPSQGTELFDGNVYPLKTAVGVFRVPISCATRERMDILANELDECVEASVSTDAFMRRLGKAARLNDEELSTGGADLRGLYGQLRQLHDGGLNGVWARIIKNAFAPLFIEPCDYIVGNPPWVNWENLPDEYRRSTVPLWHHYGMIPGGGLDSIMGKVKMDISMLMTYVAIDRYLRDKGKLGFVLSQSVFKTSGAGQGFRRFLLRRGKSFSPLVVEDMVELKPFEGAENRTVVAVFAKDKKVSYPVSYQYWRKRKTGRGSAIGFDTPYEEVTSEKITFRSWHAEPVEQSDATSAWITAGRKALLALRNVLGPSDYTAREGTNTGGANAVFWVERTGERPGGLVIVSNITEGAKRKVENVQAAVEASLLYPLLRGRDVARWKGEASAEIICTREPQGEKAIPLTRMEREFPRTLSYLNRFKPALLARKDAVLARSIKAGVPFYALGAVNDYTFAPWKVVWREQAATFTAAVVGQCENRPTVPDHKLMVVTTNSRAEAHYLCALLNSAPCCLSVAAYAINIQMDTHVLEHVRIPKFSDGDRTHLRLAELSENAHKSAARDETSRVREIEEEIDRFAARIWALSELDLSEIRKSLEET